MSEQLANAYKVGTRTQVWFTDAVVIAGLEPNDPNGPFQFWTPAVLPVLASLLCLYPAWLKLPGEPPSSQLLLAGMVALHLSAASDAACVQVRDRKTTALYYSKIIKIGRDIDRNKNSIYNDIS